MVDNVRSADRNPLCIEALISYRSRGNGGHDGSGKGAVCVPACKYVSVLYGRGKSNGCILVRVGVDRLVHLAACGIERHLKAVKLEFRIYGQVTDRALGDLGNRSLCAACADCVPSYKGVSENVLGNGVLKSYFFAFNGVGEGVNGIVGMNSYVVGNCVCDGGVNCVDSDAFCTKSVCLPLCGVSAL